MVRYVAAALAGATAVIYTYFNLASQRTPAFEVWGILIRIAQVMILVALVYLEVRLPLEHPAGPARAQPAKMR